MFQMSSAKCQQSSLGLNELRFQVPAPSRCYVLIENANESSCFLKSIKQLNELKDALSIDSCLRI